MLRKLLTLVGIGLSTSCPAVATEKFTPYSKPEMNFIYNLLFCDDLAEFKPKSGEKPAPWQATLFAQPINPNEILALAEDTTNEGRIRTLAYNLLRQNNHQVQPHVLLGVIVEVGLENGLDVLAAFSEGGIRYINQSGKLVVLEGEIPDAVPFVKNLFAASQKVIQQIGPWQGKRLPPPVKGNVRLTFLVSNGLCFGEGSMSAMQREPSAAPIIQSATQLLQYVVKISTK